jgi:hypothetical protein
MARINYCEDEDEEGQFEQWDANVDRSFTEPAGQEALREMETALLTLPRKRLIRNAVACDGDVCAVGAYLLLKRSQQQGVPLEAAQRELEAEMGPEDEQEDIETDFLGAEAGMPQLVAWKLVALNDIELTTVWELAHGPVQRGHGIYKGGIALVRDMTPEERYEKVLAFVRSKLKQAA